METDLVQQLADEYGISRAWITTHLSRPSPRFAGSECLDPHIERAWEKLPLTARIIAYLWARETASEQVRRGESTV